MHHDLASPLPRDLWPAPQCQHNTMIPAPKHTELHFGLNSLNCPHRAEKLSYCSMVTKANNSTMQLLSPPAEKPGVFTPASLQAHTYHISVTTVITAV